MIALYYILIINTETDSDCLIALKKHIYSLIYMDNGSITANSSDELVKSYDLLNGIFNEFKFDLQQFCTNDDELNSLLPDNDSVSDQSELFGLIWHKKLDTLSTRKKYLNDAADTKRKILKTIAANFDPYNFDGPIINRARIFLHELQLKKDLGWDDKLSAESYREWRNIAKQVNNSGTISIPRFVGKRNESYKLIAFCDSSKLLYGCTIYIQCESTGDVSFLLAKNRMIGRQMESKSIPSLELLSICLGCETLRDIKTELSGDYCFNPIQLSSFELYSDSLVALSWVKSYFINIDKMNKMSRYVCHEQTRGYKIYI